MPNRLFDWHEHIRAVENEYRAVRVAMERLALDLVKAPHLLKQTDAAKSNFRIAKTNLEGTYLVRLFAAFEAALRSYDRARHKDPLRMTEAAVLIDSTAGKRGQGISQAVREGAHEVRRVRNYWAHEDNAVPNPLNIVEARARLQKFLSWLPEEWE